MPKVLTIDDDRMTCAALEQMIEALGHRALSVHTISEGLKQACSGNYDVVLLDVRLSDGNGLDVLPRLRAVDNPPEVIVITGHGEVAGAEAAIRNGAWDYIRKPLSLKDVELPLIRAMEYRAENQDRRPRVALKRDAIIGRSAALNRSLDLVAEASAVDASVLITGESGTGKELFAAAIHENSDRAGESFVVVDCAALPEHLLESTLFGHRKGAFTGADRDQKGLIEHADKGTLFLDEVGELPLAAQKTFLRVLQERRFRPLGHKREKHSDFRLVAATNRDLEHEVKQGRFRKDLLFRLRSVSIPLPPLRERREDIPELALWSLGRLGRRSNGRIKGFAPEFLEVLSSYSWPGNVRELFHAMESAYTAAWDEPILHRKHLEDRIRIHFARQLMEAAAYDGEGEIVVESSDSERTLAQGHIVPFKTFRREKLDWLEREYLIQALERTHGSVREACRLSGLSKTRFYALLKKHSLSRTNS